jgi:hypothetical protein
MNAYAAIAAAASLAAREDATARLEQECRPDRSVAEFGRERDQTGQF